MLALKRYHYIAILTLVIICLLSINVLAVDDINTLNAELDKKQLSSANDSGNGLWFNFFKLIIILGLIVGAAWSLIRIFSKQVAHKMQGTWIQVVDEVTLGQNRGIVLCEVGEKLYAIGVSDANINLLFEIDNPKLLEEINLEDSMEKPASIKANDLISLIKDKLLNSGRSGKTKENLNKKEFHYLMNEQMQRMEEISNNLGNHEMNTRRSDRYD